LNTAGVDYERRADAEDSGAGRQHRHRHRYGRCSVVIEDGLSAMARDDGR
jgi:hypothetical protein